MKSSLVFIRAQVVPVLICFLVTLLLAQTDTFQKVDNLGRAQLTKLRNELLPTAPQTQLVVVGIDEESLKDLGRWPWNREVHGDFLLLVGRTKPAVIAWDILFTESTPQDSHMVKGALLAGGSVVLGSIIAEDEGYSSESVEAKKSGLTPLVHIEGDTSRLLGGSTVLLPPGALGQVTKIAFVDTPPEESDGVRHRAPLVVRVGKQVYPTLSLLTLMQYWNIKPDDVRVKLGEAITLTGPLAQRRIPIDAAGTYRINYRHALNGFNATGYSRTMKRLTERLVNNDSSVSIPDLTGKILLVGQVADGLTDFGPTPLAALTPLVLVHGNVIENVLNEDYVSFVPPWTVWLGGMLLGIAGLIRFSARKLHEQAVFSLGIPVAFGLGSAVAWTHGSWITPVAGPLFAFGTIQVFMISRRVLTEQRAKEQIKGMFGSYVSPQLVNRLVDAGEMPRLGGHEEEITAYFSDIQGFSTFSEILPPAKLVELMNEYLTACTDIVQEEGGTLDKYIGDAVVAMFGAPIALPDHAYRACVTTQRVQQKLAELRVKWKQEGEKWPEIVWRMQSRIGLNSGACIVGNMGSRTRFNYTMMGDNVNLAARMESGAKAWGTYAMCTEATKQACEQHGDRVIFRPLGRVVVMGRSQAVPVFEIAGLKDSIAPATVECSGIFSEGLNHYYNREWDAALACFLKSSELEPNVPGRTPGVSTNPSLVYLEIVRKLKVTPPPEPWGGVFVMKEK